jgi:hypothetical protein
VCRSEKLDSYDRLILSRIGIGTIASLIGCGLLGWGLIPISIQGRSFAEVLDASSTTVSTFGSGGVSPNRRKFRRHAANAFSVSHARTL